MHLKFLSVPTVLMALITLLTGCSTISDWIKQRPAALPQSGDLSAQGDA